MIKEESETVLTMDLVSDAYQHLVALKNLFNLITLLIEDYTRKNSSTPCGSFHETLKYLMKKHNLTQTDLSIVGCQSQISRLVTGQQEPNLKQIKELCKIFNVHISVFIN